MDNISKESKRGIIQSFFQFTYYKEKQIWWLFNLKWINSVSIRVGSHVRKFGDVSQSPTRDLAFPSGSAVVFHWRCIISFGDVHPSHSHPYLPQETSYLQIVGYMTLLLNHVKQIKGIPHRLQANYHNTKKLIYIISLD
jgi:hypothetical protein